VDTLKALTEKLRANRNPAAAIGDFLLAHSNDPTYLVPHLRNFLAAATADREAKIEAHTALSNALDSLVE
jgi:hypothetical protein